MVTGVLVTRSAGVPKDRAERARCRVCKALWRRRWGGSVETGLRLFIGAGEATLRAARQRGSRMMKSCGTGEIAL